VAVAACARNRRTPDDTLVVLVDTPTRTADPRYSSNNYEVKLSRLVTAGLTAVDTPDMKPRLDLAERIAAITPTSWLVRLRPGLKFSTGAALTAHDVAWTYHSVLRDGSDSLYHKSFRERFAAVTAVSDLEVRFELVKPLATLMTDLEFGIVSRASADERGRFRGGGVVGAGPYHLVGLTSTLVELARNPHYHGTAARLPRAELRLVRDATARTLMLVGGSADLAQNALRLDLLDDVARRPRIAVTSGPSVLLTYLMFNNDDPVLRDVRVRRAIALAIDRQAIVSAKFSGRAVLATGLLPPSHWAYHPVPQLARDLAAARALLDEAGLPDPDGEGPAPRLRLVYKTSTDAFRVSVVKVIAAQLAEVGIEVEVRPFEFATFFADIKKGNFQLASMQTSDITDPDFYFTYFHSSRIPSGELPDGGNRWRYRNPRVDDLTERGRHELEVDARRRLYDEVQTLVNADLPIVALWHEDNVVIANREVVGYEILPNARLSGLVHASKVH
jgi:peptide/nickel transport system substrate-binding protein